MKAGSWTVRPQKLMKEYITDMVDTNRYNLVIEMTENDLADLIEISLGVNTTPNMLAEQFFKDLLGSGNDPHRMQLVAKWFKSVIKDIPLE